MSAKENKLGALNAGILSPPSGVLASVVSQENGVLRIKPIKPKRRKKKVI